MFGLIKRFDTENLINTIPPEVAWIIALDHQFPFPRHPNPVKSERKEDTTNPLCESNHF